MVAIPRPVVGHQYICTALWAWFWQHAPETLRPTTGIGVEMSPQDTLEPDVLLLRRPVEQQNLYFPPSQVVVAAEVVSPGTERRDRVEKPAEYAAAGIPHFWRIEQDPLRVFAYDLVDGRYELVGESEGELVLSVPFAIRLPVQELVA
ncbi:hypothetical protein Ahu01nite_042210 [Winogradskya humida]|uniref:Putative restriction endonuclease domain-containing protein n=2 Tax=Winogradskya humida TaxID=113566 RepID=A0ABQ3ZRE3_9ACTN|nr:hypothetical protein Ahu01nite_042210 [Actinoplanes humidus]